MSELARQILPNPKVDILCRWLPKYFPDYPTLPAPAFHTPSLGHYLWAEFIAEWGCAAAPQRKERAAAKSDNAPLWACKDISEAQKQPPSLLPKIATPSRLLSASSVRCQVRWVLVNKLSSNDFPKVLWGNESAPSLNSNSVLCSGFPIASKSPVPLPSQSKNNIPKNYKRNRSVFTVL